MCRQCLINNLPIIKRARFFYLYDINGRRYLDLYLNGGKNFLGHRIKGLSLILKQTLSRGLTMSYPSVFKNQFINMVFTFFKEARSVYIFKLEQNAKSFLLSLTGRDSEFVQPWEEKQGIYEFRMGFNNIKYPMIFNIPLPEFMSVSVVVLAGISRHVEFKDELDALTLSLAKHMLCKLLSYENSLKVNFNLFLNPLFKIINRYMFPLYKISHHADIYYEFLNQGYLISPKFNEPSLIPLKFSQKDLANFKKICVILKSKFIDKIDSTIY